MKTFDDMLSEQAKRSRSIGPCSDPAGEYVRADAEYQEMKKNCCDGDSYGPYQVLPWDASKGYWEARDKYIDSISRGGGTINHKK
jgi:hypothetical protein